MNRYRRASRSLPLVTSSSTRMAGRSMVVGLGLLLIVAVIGVAPHLVHQGTTSSTSSVVAPPIAVCNGESNSNLLQSPYSYDGLGSGTSNYSSSTPGYGSTLPLYGPGTAYPNATAGVIVAPGDIVAGLDDPNTLYYLEPGNYVWSQINPADNDYYIGGYSFGTFAVLNGDESNQYGFAVTTSGNADWYEYFTIEGFYGWALGGSGFNSGGGPPNQHYSYLTIEDNYGAFGGGGVQLGSYNTLEDSCITSNGLYGFQVYCTEAGDSNCEQSSLTGGPQDVIVEDNEIADNAICNYDQTPSNYWTGPNPVPTSCFNNDEGTLTSALSTGLAINSLPVDVTGSLSQGDWIEVISGNQAQDWTVAAVPSNGSVSVVGQIPNSSFPAGSEVMWGSGFLWGVTGGSKFWETDGTTYDDNYVHNNYGVADWYDTNNDGAVIEGNYFADNIGQAVMYEISYNADIKDNAFVDNGWGWGLCGANAWNACYAAGNILSAVYISESGGNSNVEGNGGFGTLSIADNDFVDNWDSVSLFQSPDRFCGSPDNTSSGNCTIGPNIPESGQTYSPCDGCTSTATYYANNGMGSGGCGQGDLTGSSPSADPDYYDNCVWRTQNVTVTGNDFSFDASNIPGCSPDSASPCGENGLTSSYTSLNWNPYTSTPGGTAGTSVIDRITGCLSGTIDGADLDYNGCVSQNNAFSDNCYTYGGNQSWSFMFGDLGNEVTTAQWQGYGQDTSASGSVVGTGPCPSGSSSPTTSTTLPTTGVTTGNSTTTTSTTTTTTTTVPNPSSPTGLNCNSNEHKAVPHQTSRRLQTTDLAFTPLTTSIRIGDTRSGATDPSTYAGDTLCPGGQLTIDMPSSVPSDAGAIVAQLTAVSPTAPGYLSAFPAGTTWPGTANVNYSTGVDVGNLVTVGLGTDPSTGASAISVYNGPSGTGGPDADFTLDLFGYYAPQSSSSGDAYVPLTSSRIFDTRNGSGYPGAGETLENGGAIEVPVIGGGEVPSSASAVVVNIAVTNTTAGSYIQGYPTGSPPSAAAPTVNQNWVSGETLSTKGIISLGTSGSITLANHTGNVDVIVDIEGYFTAAGGSGALFNTLSNPTRVLDTRQEGVTGGTSAITNVQGIGAKVGVFNVADIASGPNFLTVYPSGETIPVAADVNYTSGDPDSTVDNASYGAVGSAGDVDIFNGPLTASNANVVVDEFGYFGS